MCPGPQELMSSHQMYCWLQWSQVTWRQWPQDFDDDLVRHVDDKNATVVHGNSTSNAARLVC